MKNLILLLFAISVQHLDAIPVELVQRNIPVEVRYDEVLPGIVAREQILVHGRRNLDPKVQLSTEELPLAFKHLPIQVQPEVLAESGNEEKLQLLPNEDSTVLKTLILPEKQDVSVIAPEKPVEISPEITLQESPGIKSLVSPESQEYSENIQGKLAPRPAETLENVLIQSQKIIQSGLKNLRDSFKPNSGEFSPSVEQWATLEKQVDAYFTDEKQKLLVRQGQPIEGVSSPAPPVQQAQNNWVQNIVNGFNGIASNFVQSIQSLGGPNNGNTPPTGQGDEGTGQQPPNNQGFQGFIQFFNNGISNIVSTITGTNNQGPTTSNSNLSDPGSAAAAPSGPVGFFGTIVTNVQNALGIQQPGPGTQGDDGINTSQQQNGPVQVIQSVGNAITNFFQGGNRPPPANTQGDPGSPAPSQPSNTNIIQNIQNAIQNSPLNPFRPQGGQNNQNPIQTAIQSVGTQVQQLVPAAGSSEAQVQAPAATPEGAKKPVPSEVKPAPTEVKPSEIQLPADKPVKENEIVKKQLPLDVK